MARHLLGQAGVDPESYFAAVGYTANHDETLARVAHGEVDAGAVNASVYYRRLAAADPAARALRVLWQSPPYVDYVWAARRELPSSLRQRLTDAFLDLDVSRPEQRAALEREGALGFVPVRATDFDDVLQVVRDRGQL
jgi:phosphonate transport system substrate-binding protein